MIDINKKNNKGFAMLFAVLISSMLITIGVSIFNISIKELMISASIRDSQAAYYAADSATECFFYWSYIVPDTFCIDNCSGESVSINCNGSSIDFDESAEDGIYSFISNLDTPFIYSIGGIQPESSLKLEKWLDGDDTLKNKIYVDGYNTGIGGRRVQRSYSRSL